MVDDPVRAGIETCRDFIPDLVDAVNLIVIYRPD